MEKETIRKTGAVVDIVGVAAPALVFTLSTGRTAILKKVMAYHARVADITLQLGTGATLATFVPRLVTMRLVTGFPFTLDELECPEWEFETDIYALPSAAAAIPNDVLVQVVVEERG